MDVEAHEATVRIIYGACKDVNASEIYHREGTCDGRMSMPLMVIMLVLGFITFFVNLGVIIRTVKILRHGHDKKPAFYFIGNLALSDLAIGLYVIIAFLLHMTRRNDLWQHQTCTLQIAVAVTACQETIFTIMLIAVDKYLYICHGLHYHSLVTTRRVHVAVAVSWILSLIIGSLPAMGMRMSWAESCSRCAFAQVISPSFSVIFFITSVAGPYAVVVTLYTMLLVLALKMQRARYGGSYSVKPADRSSNFRLSLMSKRSSKSSKSSRSTSLASISSGVGSTKAGRRRRRKKEMEEHKANLPSPAEKDTLIRKVEEEEKVLNKDGMEEKASKDGLKGNGGQEGMEEDGRVVAVLSGCDGTEEGDVKERESLCDGDITSNANAEGLDFPANLADASDNHSSSATIDSQTTLENSTNDTEPQNCGKSDEEELNDVSIVVDNTEDKSNGTTEPQTPRNQTIVIEEPQPQLLEVDKASNQHQQTPESPKSHNSNTLEPPSDEGGEKRGKAWLPTKYFNRVVSDTRDKVLFLKKCRAVKTVILIIGSFTATYVPFVVGSMVYCLEQRKRECLLHMLNTLLYCGVVANSLANPMLYAYGYREFRLKTKRFKGVFAREISRVVK